MDSARTVLTLSLVVSLLALIVAADSDHQIESSKARSDSDSRIIFLDDDRNDDAPAGAGQEMDPDWYPPSSKENLRITRSLSPLAMRMGLMDMDDDDDDDDDMFGSLFDIPSRHYPSYGPSTRFPHSYIEQMMRSMREQEERMRQEMERMPADSETTEEIISGPRGTKFVKRCKTTRKGSASTIWLEQVCKLVPYDPTHQKKDPEQQDQQQQIKPQQQDELQQQQQQPSTIVPQQDDSRERKQDGASGQDELRRQNMDETRETIEVPTSENSTG